ncbi:MAG: hypothetical protein A2675_02540 [Candidatus Yonathbacteria bacterium RIFCSPHIGHO2_01_FULL_51_10]|uniref:Immunity MXAN-0049 protein domain-containing protein n=1 Tax=Candidatus Yonathbacteria bacterium RIFCSPHIGHO2_01_FULL_51_10 TaxID=1802723 RepID=A0A1G2S4F5_9BACT|nr:MAG: hypothetical protein A2675_02540 [Candidatus Yonathbacteria bacterium RIFCSPHIGHO2_01_FULL_51_10]
MLEKEPIGDLRDLAVLGRRPMIPGIDFMAGERFDPTIAIPQPLRYELNPEAPGEMPWFFKAGGPLMHDRMVEALRAAGVDNIDVYDALVVDPDDGSEWTDYKAVNIVGLVAAADMTKSIIDTSDSARLITTKFEKLVLDPAKAHGLLLFRLAEKVSAIIVHERVKAEIEARKIGPLGFIPPEKWFGAI